MYVSMSDLRHLTRARVSEDGFGNLTFAITSPSEKSLARIDYEGGSNFPVLRCSHGRLFF